MKVLIACEESKEVCKAFRAGAATDEEAVWAKEDCLTEVYAAPNVDAVHVVRCRECKYHNKPPCPMRLSFNWTEDDDFCSYGEQKEGAD